jgi:hypothetical protein
LNVAHGYQAARKKHHLEVQAFLILERIAGSNEFLVSVLLQAEGQFIGKAALGTVAEGQQIFLSLRWDKPRQRFVASSQAAGSVPILSFIPFASPGTCRLPFSPGSRWVKSSELNSDVSINTETDENQN